MDTAPAGKKGTWSHSSFKVGTLTYTRTALITVMFWMLWADLCLQIMESLPNIIPLQLDELDAERGEPWWHPVQLLVELRVELRSVRRPDGTKSSWSARCRPHTS